MKLIVTTTYRRVAHSLELGAPATLDGLRAAWKRSPATRVLHVLVFVALSLVMRLSKYLRLAAKS